MKLSFLPIAPLVLFLLSYSFSSAFAGNVTYDHRSLIINGQRKLLISASIHYPGSLPAMWLGKVQTAKEGGVDVIETYVFWNGHELSPGNYYFGGQIDLVKMELRIGVYGEHLKIYQGDGLNHVRWTSTTEPPKGQPLTWYKVSVDTPPGHEPVGHMGKGLAWLNGEEIGRY
ncbi:hypothetical protein K1719_014572 [Acacia pycnantha]|nr:hypothetical protein K1719_014572 [Acacia pycnantha]